MVSASCRLRYTAGSSGGSRARSTSPPDSRTSVSESWSTDRLADLGGGAPASIRNHVGGHPSAEATVPPIDVLDDRFSALTARQIQIDIRPFTPRFAEKAFEQQLHADRIHRGDAEGVADRAVGRRAAALHEDVVGPAVLDDVPHDQEVAREIEPPDELELVSDLTARARGQRARAIARAHTAPGQLAQVAERRLARRQRKLREPVPEILQREGQPQRQLTAVGERVGKITEELRHLDPALQDALAVGQQPAAGAIEIGLLADAREDVGERTALRAREERLVGGDERHAGSPAQRHQRLKHRLLLAEEVSLDLDEAARAPKDCHEAVQARPGALAVAGGEPPRERTASSPGETHESSGVRLEVVERGRGGALGGTELHSCDQPAGVLISLAILHQQG